MLSVVRKIKNKQAKGDVYSGMSLAVGLFLISASYRSQPQCVSTWKAPHFTFTVQSQGFLNSPAYCHNLVGGHLHLMPGLTVINTNLIPRYRQTLESKLGVT